MSMDSNVPPSGDGALGAGPDQNPGQNPGPKPGLGGRVKAVLILSLTLNFLVLGAVVGGVIAHRSGPPPPVLERGVDALTFGPLGGAFSRDDRIAMRRAAEGQGADFAQLRASIRTDFTRLDAALTGEPFDEATLRAVIAEIQARTLKRMELGEELMLARIKAMSPEERRAFVARLREGVERFERRLEERREERREERGGADGK